MENIASWALVPGPRSFRKTRYKFPTPSVANPSGKVLAASPQAPGVPVAVQKVDKTLRVAGSTSKRFPLHFEVIHKWPLNGSNSIPSSELLESKAAEVFRVAPVVGLNLRQEGRSSGGTGSAAAGDDKKMFRYYRRRFLGVQ